MEPPPLSTKIIKNLGEKFCKMDPSELPHSSLMASRATKKAVSPRKAMVPKRKPRKPPRRSPKMLTMTEGQEEWEEVRESV
jgi:hypothetical protein